jgi:predicted double-glycine peptidase
VKKSVLILLFSALVAVAADRPHPAPKEKGKVAAIPEGAIRIPLQHIEQPDGISCGAAAMMSVCAYYGVGPHTIAEFKHHLHTDHNGTSYRNIISYAEKLGLEAKLEHSATQSKMNAARLEQCLKEGKPVICSIQAYADNPADYDDPKNNDNGHYVVAVGYDDDNFFFIDPSINWDRQRSPPRRGFLPKEEFVKRWHDDEGTKEKPEVLRHLGIIIAPKKGETPYLRWARKID